MSDVPLDRLDPHLRVTIEYAWHEVEQDALHRLTVPTRIRVYDALIGDTRCSIGSLSSHRHPCSFPKITQGVYRYLYLGWITVPPVIPLWHDQVALWLAINYPEETDTSWIDVMLDVTESILHGATRDDIDEALARRTTLWNRPDEWRHGVANMVEFMPYTASTCLIAMHHLFESATGFMPFCRPHDVPLHDDDVDFTRTSEIAPYVCQAVESAATIPLDALDVRAPRSPNLAVRKAFWRWWLFDLVPQAATVNIDDLGWHMHDES